MKYPVTIFLLFCLVLGANAQQNPYFAIFEPNRDGAGAIMAASQQKTVVTTSCDIAHTGPEDSADCVEFANTFDAKGRVIEQTDMYAGLQRMYVYDDKDRVTGFTEKQLASGLVDMQLAIEYDKKGRITKLVNTATGAAKSVSYNAKEERLLVSETMGAIDEVFFKNGKIVKYINKNSAELLLYSAEYEYDKNGRVIKETGVDAIEGEDNRFATTIVYNAKGKKESETYESWFVTNPAEKTVLKTGYFYNDAGQLYQKERNTPGEDVMMTVFEYDGQNRLVSADYFSGNTRLVTLFYYYR